MSQRFRVQEIARVTRKVDQAIAAHCQGRMTALLSLDCLGEGLSAFERDTLRTRDAQNRPTPELVSRQDDLVY
ncbi:hypothetical protein [Caballeronia sp. dw_19]|uniref:hypothetical protein n=1 Tax=Caballeronia sp. dw_19 TaxID=2719791 RepID=UPI001BD38240|nr:hypothetical protein [Caballeronia sp. dw_19]